MKNLYKATVVMGLATFIGMLAGVARAKFLALQLGPGGVGIFSQATTFLQSAETVCGLGMVFGIAKYVAQSWGEKKLDEMKGVLSASLLLQAVSFAVFFVFVLAFSRHISRFIFSSTGYSSILVFISCAALFSILTSSLETAMLGIGRSEVFSRARIIYNLVGVGILIAFVYTMGITGGFIYLVVSSLTGLVVVCASLIYTLRSETGISALGIIKRAAGVDLKSYTTKLLSYGAAMLVSSAFTWLSILFIRSLLIKHEGAEANGLYQVVFALASYYTPFFTNGVWGYLFPKLSATKDKLSFNTEVNHALRFILLFLTPAIGGMFLLKRELVILIFSKEFLGSLEIFPLYLFGGFFFMISYILATTFLANKQLKAYLLLLVSQNLLYAFLFARLVGRFGLQAIAISYCAMSIFAALVSAYYQMYRVKLIISNGNIRLFLLSLLFIAFILFVPAEEGAWYFTKWAFMALWGLFVVGREEKAMLLSFLKVKKG